MLPDPPLSKRPTAAFFLLAYIVAVAIGAFGVAWARSYQAGFTGADEPAHFLNSYFVADYLRHHLGTNPMGAAAEFYIHYPKISIGHWPPAYYGILGLLFTVLPATVAVAFTINLLVAVLPVLGIALALTLLCNRAVAIAGVILYAVTPLVFEGCVNFMADQPLTACVVAATGLWIAYVCKPGWGKILGFAILGALAVLIKGNGGLIALVPVFHIVLTGQWKLLRSAKPYCAALLMVLAVVPWYIVTAKIAADGFNYAAGVDYALKALLANLATLSNNLTPLGVVLALLAIVVEFRQRRQTPVRWIIVSGMLSMVLATLTLQSIVPVDIVDRYMAPALPAVVVLSALGGHWVLSWLRRIDAPRAAIALGVVLTLVCSMPGFQHIVGRAPKPDMALNQVSSLQASGQPVVLAVIDGPTGAEGAFIADRAVHDPQLERYTVRSSKLLSDSNFMGSSYVLKYATAQMAADRLRQLGVQQVVIMRPGYAPAFPHSQQLRDAVAASGSGFTLTQSLPHRFRPGVTEVYEAVGAVHPRIAAIRDFGTPAKVANLTKLKN
jgi:hypothetical protein